MPQHTTTFGLFEATAGKSAMVHPVFVKKLWMLSTRNFEEDLWNEAVVAVWKQNIDKWHCEGNIIMTNSLIEPILLHNNTMETHGNMKTLRHRDMEGTLYILMATLRPYSLINSKAGILWHMATIKWQYTVYTHGNIEESLSWYMAILLQHRLLNGTWKHCDKTMWTCGNTAETLSNTDTK